MHFLYKTSVTGYPWCHRWSTNWRETTWLIALHYRQCRIAGESHIVIPAPWPQWTVRQQVTWPVVTDVRRKASGWWQSAVTTTDVMLRCIFITECGIACFLCTMCVFDVQASSSPLGYLCAKFHFCGDLHCWASLWRKITYSVTHSPSLLDASGTEAFASEQGND